MSDDKVEIEDCPEPEEGYFVTGDDAGEGC